MNAPLKGRIVANRSGTFTASLPERRGATKRTQATFDTKAEAERWLARAVLAVNDGQEVPAALVRQSVAAMTPDTAGEGTPFGVIAASWVEEKYVRLRKGDIERQRQVEGHIKVMGDYLDEKRLTIETLTHEHALDMFLAYERNDGAIASRTGLSGTDGIDPDQLVTQREALELLAALGLEISESTFKRAKADGRIQAAETSGRAHRYLVSGLLDPAAKLVGPTDATRRTYARSTLGDIHRTFLRVMEHAEAKGLALQRRILDLELPRSEDEEAQRRAVTLVETARIAAHMHAVHQLVLWLLMILGLRISESYGILVSDVIDHGPGNPGHIKILSQGGRTFERRNGLNVDVTGHVNDLKRDSRRALVVPVPLMDLIRTIIAVFHADPDRTIRSEARLVPGLQKSDVGGQAGFRAKLEKAARAEGIDLRLDLGRTAPAGTAALPGAHDLRKDLASDLDAMEVKTEHIEGFLGQRLGERVIHAHYLLRDERLRRERRIAKRLTKMIRRELNGNLMIPTTVRATTRSQPNLADRAAEIDAALAASGWQVDQLGVDGDWFTVNDVAALRNVTEAQIRDDIRSGRLKASRAARRDQQGERYLIAVDDAYAYIEATNIGSDINVLAEELGVSYDTIRHYISRHDSLDFEKTPGRKAYVVSDQVAQKVRDYFRAQADLATRAVRLPDVMRSLGLRRSRSIRALCRTSGNKSKASIRLVKDKDPTAAKSGSVSRP